MGAATNQAALINDKWPKLVEQYVGACTSVFAV
jgi:hypothetical protein